MDVLEVTELIFLSELKRITRDAPPHAREYDFDPKMQKHLIELKKRIG
jgi:hypothetical protein